MINTHGISWHDLFAEVNDSSCMRINNWYEDDHNFLVD